MQAFTFFIYAQCLKLQTKSEYAFFMCELVWELSEINWS